MPIIKGSLRRKACGLLVGLEEIFKIRWSGKLVVDEKWVKLGKEWIYVFLGVDEENGEPLRGEVYPRNRKAEKKAFLLLVKSKGYLPKILVTDLDTDYDKAIGSVFPEAKHHKCVFHAERAAKNLVAKYLKDSEESIRKSIKEDIRHVFGSKEIETFTERYKRCQVNSPSRWFRALNHHCCRSPVAMQDRRL